MENLWINKMDDIAKEIEKDDTASVSSIACTPVMNFLTLLDVMNINTSTLSSELAFILQRLGL